MVGGWGATGGLVARLADARIQTNLMLGIVMPQR
jgi:hypothetical protein